MSPHCARSLYANARFRSVLSGPVGRKRVSLGLAAAQEVILRCDRAFLLCEGVGFLPVPRRVPCPRALCVICWRLPPAESQPRRSAEFSWSKCDGVVDQIVGEKANMLLLKWPGCPESSARSLRSSCGLQIFEIIHFLNSCRAVLQ
jgi:hypothetical protein